MNLGAVSQVDNVIRIDVFWSNADCKHILQ